jgi:hypothetical protein
VLQAEHPPVPYFAWPTVGQALAFTAGPLLLAFLVIAAATLATQRTRPVPVVAGLVLTALAMLPLLDLGNYAFLIPLWDQLPKGTFFENGLRATSGTGLANGQTVLALVLLGLARLLWRPTTGRRARSVVTPPELPNGSQSPARRGAPPRRRSRAARSCLRRGIVAGRGRGRRCVLPRWSRADRVTAADVSADWVPG